MITSRITPGLKPLATTDGVRAVTNPAIGDMPMPKLNGRQVNTRPLKLMVMVVDAMGFAFVNGSSKDTTTMANLINDPKYAADAKLYKTSIQLPSMSLPNWYSQWIGVDAGLHGTTGNDNLPPTQLDTIIKEVSLANKTSYIIADPLWANMIPTPYPAGMTDNTTKFFYDDYCSNSRHGCMVSWDDTQYSKALDVLAKPRVDRPDFFFLHFLNVDSEGHSWGAASQQYARAMNKTASTYLKTILDLLDEDYVFILTADHGQVPVGGHGGLNGLILQTPVWVYRKGSAFGSTKLPAELAQFYTEDQMQLGPDINGPQPGAGTSLDLSCLMAGVLGIPVPRESFGVFARDALAVVSTDGNGGLEPDAIQRIAWKYYGLALQKQQILSHYATQQGRTNDDPIKQYLGLPTPVAPPMSTNATGRRLQERQQELYTLIGAYQKQINAYRAGLVYIRSEDANKKVNQNLTASLCILFLVWLPFMALAIYWVYDEVKYRRLTGSSDPNVVVDRGLSSKSITTSGWMGWLSAAFAIACGVISFVATYTWYRNPVAGEWRWDMTLFNSMTDAIEMGMMFAIPVIVLSAFFIGPGWGLTRDRGVHDSRLAYWWMSCGTVACQMAAAGLLVCNFVSGMILPFSNQVGLFNEATWTQIFRCFTVTCAILPALVMWGIAQSVAASQVDRGCCCGPAKRKAAVPAPEFVKA